MPGGGGGADDEDSIAFKYELCEESRCSEEKHRRGSERAFQEEANEQRHVRRRRRPRRRDMSGGGQRGGAWHLLPDSREGVFVCDVCGRTSLAVTHQDLVANVPGGPPTVSAQLRALPVSLLPCWCSLSVPIIEQVGGQPSELENCHWLDDVDNTHSMLQRSRTVFAITNNSLFPSAPRCPSLHCFLRHFCLPLTPSGPPSHLIASTLSSMAPHARSVYATNVRPWIPD